MTDIKILCPKCDWVPDGGKHWICTCGHVLNTFETNGVCPVCKTAFKETQCVTFKGGCGAFSLHLDWYRNLDQSLENELQSIKITVYK